MLGTHGIQPVTLVFNNAKNCFLHLSSNLVTQLSLQENHVLELSWGISAPVFLSWITCRHSAAQEDKVELSRQLGEKLGLKDGEQGFLRPCQQVQSVQQVFVEPLSSDDWEILELHALTLEQQLLDQIRVVFSDGVFPVWVDQHTVIFIRIAALSPSVSYGRLEQFTELIVSPKQRSGSEGLSYVPSTPLTDPTQNQRQQEHQNFDIPASPTSSAESRSHNESPADQFALNHSHQGGQWGGIADLKSLVRYMFRGRFDPVKDIPSVPVIPALLRDCILRVCKSPPTGVLCSGHGDVHLQPWVHEEQDRLFGGQPALTYGRLSRIHSPKEMRERAKQAMEAKKKKKKNKSASQMQNEEEDCEEDSVVVRVICHNVEKLHEGPKSSRAGEIHNGKVWIPETLRSRLQIDLHSAVRIQPLKSIPQVAQAVMLQPLQQMADNERVEDVQTAFLGWLHAQSHEPLACLTGRSSIILLPHSEGKSEFLLTVLKPEREPKMPDEIFLLTAGLLQKTNIQVVREVVTFPSTSSTNAVNEKDFPSLCSLGGVKDISMSAFDHISHSLMGSPLSRELVSVGRGLKSGALLITGAKGIGKTALAKALCRKAIDQLDAHVEVMDCKTLKGKRADTVRQRWEEVFEQAVWRQPSVILLDDLDHVTGAATSPEHEQGPEAILRQHLAQSLRDLVDEAVTHTSQIALVVTAHSEHSLHPSLTQVQGSHFFQTFTKIQVPDQAQRVDILKALICKKSAVLEECLLTLNLEGISKETEGYLPRDLTLLLDRAIHANAAHSRISNSSGLCLTQRDFLHALKGFTPPSLWSAKLQVPSESGMERVGGLHHARQLLMDTVLLPAKYPALFSSLPIRQRSGVLLYGAPGTGKTLLAGAVAKESGMNFISVKGPELLSKYIGASEMAVRDVFQRAQAAKPCILFFDEFDSLAPRRGHDSTGVTDRVVNQLLTQLDGVEGLQGVYVLAATSRPDLIDPALLRPGRLDKCLYCPPPDQEARLEILRAQTHSVPLAGDVDLEQIAASTELFTGADLKALLYNAQLEAIHSSVGPGLLPDLGSGSDSDVSLSSMIFLNHSSASEDSAGEGDAGLDHSMMLLETTELPPEDPRHNIWRLYFGSSYESELGNPSPSELNSQCLSGPNSTTHELTGTSVRDMGCCHAPALMASLQDGFQELSHEQTERLRADINNIKNNYRRPPEDSSFVQTGPSKSAFVICQSHLTSALANTRASVSKQDWRRYTELFESFGASREGKQQNAALFKPGQRVTLA
ncbi:peroxisomal ATPase PEX1 [Chanos chanos]|uniref:Peroxisomal ATPase PEX1 n=1 Tax=Chanos chanos TaxID=29144 RepID=A0A6J2WN92_CHACN|nr:peroxisome biogenesis factor 1 [Chanos chanos]